ncbi:universal stress protein [Trueperella pyogenes]|uniref:universal stress protein n=1 Tax=Trueperella pyogenes TaxID=1661 RepID=UPI00066146C8|nr:universal stress protein [Trueperella pyogenes]MBF1735973.1 universal stress protein [Trueperella pyogenes]
MAIVLSYYGNRESDAALDQAVRLASWMRTSLMIVVASHECGGIFADENSAEAHLWERLGGTEVSFEVMRCRRDMSMAETVLDWARRIDADMIVIGLRPGGSKSTTIGNTATQILLDAPCPVMTSSWRFEDTSA